jgi:anti-sigma regulatory factor (Ser/Thr protein kinase)
MLSHVMEGVTRLPVSEATNGARLEADRVYVIPPGADLTIHDGTITLVPRERTGRPHLPIDTFFRSLAEDRHGGAIGVVLSGSGADGREGLRAIKAKGGIAIAQEPASAQFRSMPESAIAAGVVDFCGSPEDIAGELIRLSRHPYVAASGLRETPSLSPVADDDRNLAAVFALMRKHAGVDFRGYKRTTILRRIDRRMALRHVSQLDEYARVLGEDPGEARALAGDMLIHVTSFFGEPDAFAALKEQVFRQVVERKADGDSIRIWVPGCSTGEEVSVSGKLLLDMGPVDLAATVQEAVDVARSSAQAKGLDLTFTIDGTIGSVYGDAGRLQQIVSNLLSNAIKFTPHGGHISVRLEQIDAGAQITVADDGVGIRAEVLPHLFDRFVQADSSVTRTHGGLGLGLSIVRHLVEVHHGTVQVERRGKGSDLPRGATSGICRRRQISRTRTGHAQHQGRASLGRGGR